MKKVKLWPESYKAFTANFSKLLNAAYIKQRYNTPFFVIHETLKAFQRHNVLGLSASLSFYAMFALIPLVLLMFFLLSHLVFSSNYAIVKLAIITGNLVPQLSNTIMLEVYSASKKQAAWGAVGLFVLLWAVTPLAGAMRSTFYNIAALIEAPSFLVRKIKDVIAILGILLLFFLFTFAGLALEKVVAFLTFLGENSTFLQHGLAATAISLMMTTALITAFYFAFFPVKLDIKHILIGALFTAVLWLFMRPAFTLFLSMHQSYGSVFGSMKNLFISITWLYFNFAAFLLGTELIATLRKKDVLLMKGLFDDTAQQHSRQQTSHLQNLMQRYGHTYANDDYIFKRGESISHLYYLVSGNIKLLKDKQVIRTIEAGDYFGELAMLTNAPSIADALVTSAQADVISMHTDNIETLLTDEPKVAMKFLRHLASRLQKRDV